LVQIALLPKSLTSLFGGAEPWPIIVCPSEDNNQLISYTILGGQVCIVDFLQGALADPDFERVIPVGQAGETFELREVNMKDPERFNRLHQEAQGLHDKALLFALDEQLLTAWRDEYCDRPNLVDLGHWPAMLFGGLPRGFIRLPPGRCPLSGAPMTAVGIISNPVGNLVWSPIFHDFLRIAYCPESSCLTVSSGFNMDVVWEY